MKKLQLTGSLLIGHGMIDEEHIHLASLVNKSMEAIASGARHLCADTISEIVDKLGLHFETEERIMAELGYPDAFSHSEHHVECMNKLLMIQERCSKADCMGEDCILDVVGLFVDDLISADMGFKGHLQLIGYRA